MGPGAPEKLGAPILLETLALYSYMTFEIAEVTKIGKGVFFKVNRQQNNYGIEINENEIQNCKSLEQNT